MSATKTTPVLPVVKGDDGVWEAVIDVVRGSDDIETRDLDGAQGVAATVRVAGDERALTVFIDADGRGVVRYDDALPA